MRAIVHIGAPKTGSTTIQEFLYLNSEELARRGFRFSRNVENRKSQWEYPLAALARLGKPLPDRTQQVRYSSPDLAEHRRIGERVEEDLAEKRKRWREPVALFSSEHIVAWLKRPEDIRSLDEIFSRHFEEIRYVLYIREQSEWLLSQYSEHIKRGGTERLETFFARRLRSLDHRRCVMRWVRAVGRERFELRLLDRSFLVDGDLLNDFAAVCGFDPTGLKRPPRMNERLKAPALELLRILNGLMPKFLEDGSRNPLHNGFQQRFKELNASDHPYYGLTEEQYRQIEATVAEGNEALRREFFPTRQVLFFPPPRREPPDREKVLQDALHVAARLIYELRAHDTASGKKGAGLCPRLARFGRAMTGIKNRIGLVGKEVASVQNEG